ncbi:MAG TPA: FeoB-associated Cys-rich membrane protein [Gemmatimonadaceae bacterium]|nr:FeoB-associated Cys-rich membrane protein [Gemmatimonadaceae bacterium]
MITTIIGVVGAAVLFGLFSMLRPRDKAGCTGHCAGCTGDSACESDGVKR